MLWLLALFGCYGTCGTAEFRIGGTGAALYDVDGDGMADLTERCGTLWDSFGSRRADLGLSQILFSPGHTADGEGDFAISTYVLPASDVWFRSELLEVGTVIPATSLNGAGIHIPDGEPSSLYAVFPFTGGELEILDRREVRGTAAKVLADDDPVDWRVRWSVTYGGTPNAPEQRFEGEDWLQFTDGIEIGEVQFPPPDWP